MVESTPELPAEAIDLGFSHVALFVQQLEPSVAFYERYGGFVVTHRRTEVSGSRVAYLSDAQTLCSVVLVELRRPSFGKRLRRLVSRWLPPLHHFGVGVPSRPEVDRLTEVAQAEGCLRRLPRDLGLPAGYFAVLRDPDGNDFEVSYGQQMFRRLADHKEPGGLGEVE